MGNKRHRLGVGGKRRRGLEMWRVGVKRRGSRRRRGGRRRDRRSWGRRWNCR